MADGNIRRNLKQKTFSASTILALDVLVNAFIGIQRVDGRSVERKVEMVNYLISGGSFYSSIIYSEETYSN